MNWTDRYHQCRQNATTAVCECGELIYFDQYYAAWFDFQGSPRIYPYQDGISGFAHYHYPAEDSWDQIPVSVAGR